MPLILISFFSVYNVNVPFLTSISALTFILFVAEILTPTPLAKAADNVPLLTVFLPSAKTLSGVSPLPCTNSDSLSLPLLIDTSSGSNNHSLASTIALSLMNK
ncbi:hypothetical protein BVZ90_01362 [Haemophilus influenzae]|nr:hypothetical protein BVZ90_01362 [Haemophilus influenzae]